jgi:hypothetical protein
MNITNLKKIFKISTTSPVFVIGTGRSGTHWIGYCLGKHPDISATIEMQPMFDLSTKMALNQELEDKLFRRLVIAYKWQMLKTSHRIYLDKTHPNIWLAEKLKQAFPQARFIAIERNPYATVASMIKHKGVSAWHTRWREFPIPNRFLGITEELANSYDTIPLASRCAIRWLAHHNRINELRNILGESLLIMTYESLAHSTKETLNILQRFLGLQSPIPMPDIITESMHKWREQLSDTEIMQIHGIVGFKPDAPSALQ